MPQFTVHRNRNPESAGRYPYLVDIQHDLFEDLQTRVVIPVTSAETFGDQVLKYLMPVITIEQERYVLLTPQLAGIARSELGEAVGEVSWERNEIIGAFDFLISGI